MPNCPHHHYNVTNLIHIHFHNHFIVSWSSTCFGRQVIPEQYSGEYNPMYQLVYDQQVKPHPTKPPDFYPEPYPNKTVFPQPVTSQKLQCT
jgi:hypothetical protein